MRLLISLYERQLTLKAKFCGEKVSAGKTTKAGIYADLESPFKNGFVYPDPKQCMTDIKDKSIAKFKLRFDSQDPDFSDNVSR